MVTKGTCQIRKIRFYHCIEDHSNEKITETYNLNMTINRNSPRNITNDIATQGICQSREIPFSLIVFTIILPKTKTKSVVLLRQQIEQDQTIS